MKNEKGILLRKVYVFAIVVFVACVSLLIAKPELSYAGKKPFKLLKVGSKNLTKGANQGYMPYAGSFDGGVELWMDDYKGSIKKGSKFKIKLKSGYKSIIYFCREGKKQKRIKNNFKIPSSDDDWYISLTIKEGKKKSYYWLVFGSSMDDDDDEDDDWDEGDDWDD